MDEETDKDKEKNKYKELYSVHCTSICSSENSHHLLVSYRKSFHQQEIKSKSTCEVLFHMAANQLACDEH